MGMKSIASAALVWAFWAVMVEDLRAADWPQFLGPRRDGTAADQGLRKTLDDRLQATWRRPVGAGVSGPVVAGEVVYLFQQVGDDETLVAFDAATGAERWRLGYPCDYAGGMFREKGPRATPCVAGDVIVTFGAAGVLQAVGREGKLRWRRNLHQEYDVPEGYFGASGSPLVHEGLALLNLGGAKAGLAAFHLKDGKSAWTATEDGASYASPIVAELAGKPTALFLARTGLHGVDPATGAERFFTRFRARMEASVNAATPLARGNEILLSAAYGVGSTLLDAGGATPRVIWREEDVLVCHFNTPVRVGDFVYGIHGRHESHPSLQCADWRTGKPRWTVAGFGSAHAIAADGKLWLMREDGALALAEAMPTAHRSLGQTPLFRDGPVRAHPALADGYLYVRGPQELLRVSLRP